jgi:hypothetical protein
MVKVSYICNVVVWDRLCLRGSLTKFSLEKLKGNGTVILRQIEGK